VNGHAITTADVQALMRASSLTAREALDRLQAEQLLMAEAERRGTSAAAIDEVAVRAAVQALLDREAASNVASESDLRAAYDKDARFHAPETRSTVHVLARLDGKATEQQVQAALAVAKKAVEDLRTLDSSAVQAKYTGTIDGVTVKTEQLPPADSNAPLVKEYLTAMFSIEEAGVVPEPVRTRFGWHAIRVLQITPARDTPFEEAVTVLRGEVTSKKQAAGVDALLLDLRHANPVELADDLDDKLSLVDGAEAFR
jgi:parvulin-like peptidyl-prolyl isomerase